MMLQPGDEVKCFITKKHPLIAKKGPMTKIIAATIEHEPYHLVQFGRNLYFVMKLTVRSNKNFNDFKDGVLDESEMVDRCGRQQGHGIVFDFVTTFGKSGRTNSPQCIYFSNLIEHPMSIMFWKNNHHTSRVVDLKASLADLKDMQNVASTVSVFLEELYGDAMMTYALAEYWEHRTKRVALEMEAQKYKEAPASDAKIESRLVLKNNDKDFTEFREYMDRKCNEAIMNLYGRFSVISKPILSQRLLCDLTHRFKTTLSAQHHAIMCFLNKKESSFVQKGTSNF